MSKKHRSETIIKLAAGGFVTDFINPEPWMTMIEEANSNGHKIEKLFIAYLNSVDTSIVELLSKKVSLVLIKVQHENELIDKLRFRGVDEKTVENLCDFNDPKRLPTESAAFNQIVLYSILEGIGQLLLISEEFNFYSGVDFIGLMTKPFGQADVIATTAIPYRPDIEKILKALQPMKLIDTFFLSEYSRFIGQILMPDENAFQLLQPARIADYGNMMLDLNKVEWMPPFFSQTHTWKGDDCICAGSIENFILQAQGRNVEILEVPIPSSISTANKWSKWDSMLSLTSRIPFFVWNLIEKGLLKNRYNEVIRDIESKSGIIDQVLGDIEITISSKDFWEHWDNVKSDLEKWILQQMVIHESWQKAIQKVLNHE